MWYCICLCMAVHGCVWLCMAEHDCMTVHSCVWLCMVVHDYAWLSMAVHGCAWLSMTVHCCVWLYMAVHDYSWLNITIQTMYACSAFCLLVVLGIESETCGYQVSILHVSHTPPFVRSYLSSLVIYRFVWPPPYSTQNAVTSKMPPHYNHSQLPHHMAMSTLSPLL